MIGKITVGKSFRGCIAYCLNDKISTQNDTTVMKDRADVLMYNKCYGSEKELVQQFNEVRQLNPKLSKPVMHITLSLAPGETLGKDKLMEMTEQCAKELGFENNQYIAISHRDTNHQHLHIVANRIGFDKRTVSDSNSYKRVANYCRKMELKYNLQKLLNPIKYLFKEQRNTTRFDQRKERLRQHIKESLKDSYSFQQFEQKLKERRYQIIKGRGISFTDEKEVKMKGSEVDFSLQTIEKILEKQAASQAIKVRQNISQSNLEVPLKSVDVINENKNSEQLSDILYNVVNPQQNHEEIDHHLLPNKRKKKHPKSYRL